MSNIAAANSVALQAIESEPAFEALVTRRKCQHLWPAFQARDWTTAASFAYTMGVNYSQVIDDDFITRVVCPLLGKNRGQYDAEVAMANREPVELLRLRQLFTESQRMLHASLKTLENPDQPVQNISQADRRERRKAYQTQLEGAGQWFENELCHGHCIEDDAFLMLQKGYLSYLHPKHCPSRDQETAQEHLTNKGSRPDAAGFKVTNNRTGESVNLSNPEDRPQAACTTLMDLSDALRRRGGGFQVGGLLDASDHEKIRSFLIKHLRKESPRADLIGPSMEEVLDCDKAIFIALQKKCDRDASGLASLPLYMMLFWTTMRSCRWLGTT